MMSYATDEHNPDFPRHRHNLESIRVQSHSSYDKVLITLSSGGLVVTLKIMSEWAERPLICGWMMHGSLSLLGITIILTAASFLMSAKASAQEIKWLDDQNYTPKCNLKRIIPAINYITLITFVTGLIFLGVFTSLNFHHISLSPP